MGERPDAALYTLFLRALLQQGKWQEGKSKLDKQRCELSHLSCLFIMIFYVANYLLTHLFIYLFNYFY